jgi:hypothetical protein
MFAGILAHGDGLASNLGVPVSFARQLEKELTEARDNYAQTLLASIKLEGQLTEARAELEDNRAFGIHSCHDNCQRLECVQRRQIADLRAQLAATRQGLIDEREDLRAGYESQLAALEADKLRLREALEYIAALHAFRETILQEMTNDKARAVPATIYGEAKP